MKEKIARPNEVLISAATDNQLICNAAYGTVLREEFHSMVDVDRYDKRLQNFDEIISGI